jgi:hypothetical protein
MSLTASLKHSGREETLGTVVTELSRLTVFNVDFCMLIFQRYSNAPNSKRIQRILRLNEQQKCHRTIFLNDKLNARWSKFTTPLPNYGRPEEYWRPISLASSSLQYEATAWHAQCGFCIPCSIPPHGLVNPREDICGQTLLQLLI